MEKKPKLPNNPLKVQSGRNAQNLHIVGRKHNGKVFTKPSETIPDEAISIRELIAKQANGIPVIGHLTEPQYGGGGLDPRKLDYQEIHEARQTLQRQFYENRKQEAIDKAEEFKNRLRDQLKAEMAQETEKDSPALNLP